MTTDLLLIQPPVHLRRTELGARQVSPNIGLAYIAATARAQGHTVAVIDAHAERLDLTRIVAQAQALDPRWIGLSAMTYQILAANAVAEALKRALPHTPTVLGGCHATAVPAQTLEEFPAFDVLVTGEGEHALARLLAASAGQAMEPGPGIWVRGADGRVSGHPPERIADLDRLPFPAFDLFPLRAYQPFYAKRWCMELPLSASRGCPFQCVFCTKVMGDRARFRSAESLLEEVQRDVTDFQVEQVIFTDENFTLKRSLVHDFCEGLLRRGLAGRIRFICQSRVTVDPDTLQLMARAGFSHITFGLEAGDQDILDRAGKQITLARSRQVVKDAKEAGLIVDGNFILGLPWETEATIRRTIDFACGLPLDYLSFFLLVPYPGSEVHRMARAGEGHLRLVSERWEDYGKQTGGALELTTVSRARLERLQLLGYLRFYSHPQRWLSFYRKVSLPTLWAFLRQRLPGVAAFK